MIEPLTNHELDQRLYQLPIELGKKAEEATTARFEYETAEANYENLLDKEYLTVKATDERKTIKEIEAEARVKYHQIRLECIQKEAIWKKLENQVEQLKNKFDSCRSSIKLRVAEIDKFGG